MWLWKVPLFTWKLSTFGQQIISTYQCLESSVVWFKQASGERARTLTQWHKVALSTFSFRHFSLQLFKSAFRIEYSIYRGGDFVCLVLLFLVSLYTKIFSPLLKVVMGLGSMFSVMMSYVPIFILDIAYNGAMMAKLVSFWKAGCGPWQLWYLLLL